MTSLHTRFAPASYLFLMLSLLLGPSRPAHAAEPPSTATTATTAAATATATAPATPIKAVRGAEFPRIFTRGLADPGDWAQLEPLFTKLEARLKAVKTPEDLNAWLLLDSELSSVISEERARRSIAYTCHTDDPRAEKANIDFIEQVSPHLREWGDRLDRLYLACPARLKADRRRLEVYDRNLENGVKLFRKENIPLGTADSKLAKDYQKISGAMTVPWRGAEKTLQQMALVQEETDRQAREESWRLVAGRRLQDSARLNSLYDEMIRLRTQMAANAGFANYRDYAHQNKNRFDYTPQDCLAFDEAIARQVVPLLAKIRRERRDQLGLPALRPWDLAVDPQGLSPLRPFKNGAELEAGCAEVFQRLSPALAGQFAILRQGGLLDLESRKGKAPGGYSSTLAEVRVPFIFMNAAGTNQDAFTLLHESGHAFHALACRQEPLLAYRGYPSEIAEVASMSMELFGASRIEAFYPNPEEARRARREHLKSIVTLLPWIATIDSFQQWVYTHPGHTDAEREAQWLALEAKYSPEVDWSGLDAEHRSMWQRQSHLFASPFYYIEYGISQLGALQFWVQFRQNPQQTLDNYRHALSLGGSRPLPELFAAGGIKFDFSEQTLAPLIQAISEELDRLK